jgi:IclR family acetate operon transcriptional repressor
MDHRGCRRVLDRNSDVSRQFGLPFFSSFPYTEHLFLNCYTTPILRSIAPGRYTSAAESFEQMAKRVRNPIAKALVALTSLVEQEAHLVGVREMAKAIGVSPTSAHRLLSALAEAGFVQQDPESARYSLGLEFLRLAQLAAGRLVLRRVAIPHLRLLVEVCNETALLGLYDPSRRQMMFAASIDSGHMLRYAVETNKWLPIHAGASGLAIMAFLKDEEIDDILKSNAYHAVTPRTLAPKELLKCVAAIRRDGFAFSKGQRIPGAVGIAVPIFGAGREILADVCLTIPEQRFRPGLKQTLVDHLKSCARKISTQITSESDTA